jgi:hypothetical protein
VQGPEFIPKYNKKKYQEYFFFNRKKKSEEVSLQRINTKKLLENSGIFATYSHSIYNGINETKTVLQLQKGYVPKLIWYQILKYNYSL